MDVGLQPGEQSRIAMLESVSPFVADKGKELSICPRMNPDLIWPCRTNCRRSGRSWFVGIVERYRFSGNSLKGRKERFSCLSRSSWVGFFSRIQSDDSEGVVLCGSSESFESVELIAGQILVFNRRKRQGVFDISAVLGLGLSIRLYFSASGAGFLPLSEGQSSGGNSESS